MSCFGYLFFRAHNSILIFPIIYLADIRESGPAVLFVWDKSECHRINLGNNLGPVTPPVENHRREGT